MISVSWVVKLVDIVPVSASVVFTRRKSSDGKITNNVAMLYSILREVNDII